MRLLPQLAPRLAMLALAALACHTPTALAQGTAFTYQGRLNDGATPANGNYDLRFALYDAASAGSQIAALTTSATSVSNGLFTVALDFGSTPFTAGAARWLEIAVRTNGNGSFTTLANRQQLTPAPFALFAPNAAVANSANAVAAGNITGTLGLTQLPSAVVTNNASGVSLNGAFIGSGGGLTNLNAAQLKTGLIPTNALPGFQSPYQTIAGGYGNSASGFGATVSGGGYDGITLAGNAASGGGATIGGGNANTASGLLSIVSGGNNNRATNSFASVPGGQFNVAGGLHSFAAGRKAVAVNDGAFVWADTTDAYFGSTNNNSFNVRANGGVRWVTSGAGMTLDGLPVLTSSPASGIAIQQNTNGAPNVIEGSAANDVAPGVVGATVSGGGALNYSGLSYSNQVSADFGTVAGGRNNAATGFASTVGGGYNNIAEGPQSAIAGGFYNQAANEAATVSGGYNNVAAGNEATIAGGYHNGTTSDNATVGGGTGNVVQGYGGTIAGGQNNRASGMLAAVGGGISNTAITNSATIAGGTANLAGGVAAVVGGGVNNSATGVASTISGGTNNWANGFATTISGGSGNANNGMYDFIGGGLRNTNNGNNAVIGGGEKNNTSANFYATIGGGWNNFAGAQGATVGGGVANTSTGSWATVSGGYGNIAGGDSSFAAGNYAYALHQSAFVWSDFEGTPFASTANNQFLIRAQGGVGINTPYPTTALTINGVLTVTNAGTSFTITPGYLFGTASNNCVTLDIPGFGQKLAIWDNLYISDNVYANGVQLTSDRNAKENFTPLNPKAVLDKVASLPVSEWNYKQDSTNKHIGPMAQDFHAAFGLNGEDDKHISVVDESGVALAAIQGLNQKLEEQKAENAELKRQLAELKAAVQKLAHQTP